MGLLRKITADAFELARALRKEPLDDGQRPSVKDAAKAALTQDGYKVLFMSRIREAARRWHIPGVNHTLRFVTTVLYSIEIGNDIELGEGINFTHTLGTVIGGTSKVGSRVKFMGNNTIGTAKDNGCPVIEDDVVIGCGARVLGPIRIGRGAFIGANAVVLSDVPPGAIATGIPAKIQERRGSSGDDRLPAGGAGSPTINGVK
ncbi:MAG TPA: serine O-acetyltransferase EpsC [Labilithrix sp.]|nr:serine O-acetyltransferase EpsC [Labilithrix sp.]